MYMFVGNTKDGDLIIITDIEYFNIQEGGILRLYKSEKCTVLLIDDFENLKLKYIEKGCDDGKN